MICQICHMHTDNGNMCNDCFNGHTIATLQCDLQECRRDLQRMTWLAVLMGGLILLLAFAVSIIGIS